jgi:hypothetical protein
LFTALAFADQAGSIRGVVRDQDFDAPLPNAQVMIAETGKTVTTTDEGNFVFSQVQPGNYTVVISKDGYTRQVKANVVVSPGQMTDLDAKLSGEFTEMEEFVVQEIQIGSGTEALLLDLRMESPALLDSISAELMSQAGAGDAASALKLVAGATVQEGKYAVIRGLPDRYVNSQMNGFRLPTADADKRAVQLDQFPSDAIQSVQVSKTFTPDQQGDASGGAVNIVLKGIPEEPVFKVSFGSGFNTNTANNQKFLSYTDGGTNTWGFRKSELPKGPIPQSEGASGSQPSDAPFDYNWSATLGNSFELDTDVKIGFLASMFYDHDSSYKEGTDDSYFIDPSLYAPGGLYAGQPRRLTPKTSGVAEYGGGFTTSLFDIKEAAETVQWGGLGVVGLETEDHRLTFTYMHTHTAEDKVIWAQDIRGRDYFIKNGLEDIADPDEFGSYEDAPYLRAQTLQYTERTTETWQFQGHHVIPFPQVEVGDFISFDRPEIDWAFALSSARLYQPDKRMFRSKWLHEKDFFGLFPEAFYQWKEAANWNIGNFNRVWKDINEENKQYSIDLKIPFEQYTGDEGYFKTGIYKEQLSRSYDQDTYANKGAGIYLENKPFDFNWARHYYGFFPDYSIPNNAEVEPWQGDVDYEGKQNISAWYYMFDLPLTSFFNVIGGIRFEETELKITPTPEDDAIAVYKDDVGAWTKVAGDQPLYDEVTNVDFYKHYALPSLGFVLKPGKVIDLLDNFTLRGSYTETTARQTFKELSAVLQQEYPGADPFIGNPDLEMSSLKNYDLRLDYEPYDGGLVSVSYFKKEIENPIEYVSGYVDFAFTAPLNFPKGQITGWEFEIRQKLGHFFESLEGISIGGNATLIDSEVTLPEYDAAILESRGYPAPTRPMRNAPEHLYNLFLTCDLTESTKFGVFYTVRGDTLVLGASGDGGDYVPNIYEKEYGTLNMSISHKFAEIWTFKFQVKNILNPEIQTIYRDDYFPDKVHTSYKKGRDFSFSLSATF